MGRTPFIAYKIRDSCRPARSCRYLQAVLRVWNRYAPARQHPQARIKILVHELGEEEFRRQVEEEFAHFLTLGERLPAGRVRPHRRLLRAAAVRDRRSATRSTAPTPISRCGSTARSPRTRRRAMRSSTSASSRSAASPATLSAEQMDLMADLAERYSFDELRVDACAEPRPAARPQGRSLRGVAGARRRPASATPTSTSSATSSPAPGSTIAASPTPARSRSRRRSSERFADPARQRGHRRAQDQDLGLHQRLRPPPRGQHRHPRRRPEGQRELPAAARRLGRRGHQRRPRSPAPASTRTASSTRSSARSSSYRAIREPGERFLDTYRRVGMDGFKEAIYG